jgi:tetratricopeptide (TPR) repeat protein|tara:strand:+ start:438 stop:953 length:516 start_codon:yes stop_codon:yes gene_type:complete
MFPKIIKLILAALTTAYSIYQFIEGSIGNGIFLLLIAGMFILLYYKNEFILLAFFQLRKQNFEGTLKWLNRISNPEQSLVKKQQGYFNYLHGIILSQTNLTKAEKYFKKAIELGLSMDTDLAMANLSLSGIYMQKRRKREATLLLNKAKKLDTQGVLSGQIKQMQQQMKRI